MFTVKWKKQATKDLQAIESYYTEVAPDYAPFFVQQVLEKAQQLGRFPRIGRTVPEIGLPAIREIIYRGYRIMYLVEDEEQVVEILTIQHSARQFGGL